jgi:hypothetical protein
MDGSSPEEGGKYVVLFLLGQMRVFHHVIENAMCE